MHQLAPLSNYFYTESIPICYTRQTPVSGRHIKLKISLKGKSQKLEIFLLDGIAEGESGTEVKI